MIRAAAIAFEARLPIDLNDPITGSQTGAPTAAPGNAADSRSDSWAASVSGGVSRGDPAALEALYRDWFARAFALARTWSRRDEAFCLDAVQETMLRAVRSLKALPTLAALDGWMTAATRSAVIDALRREARRLARERRIAGAHPGEPDAELESIRSALIELSPEEQHLLRSRFLQGETLGRIAGELGATVGAVHGRIRRTLRALRNRIKESDRDD